MANVIINDEHLSNIADAIRTKNGTQNTYKPSQMADAIDAISGGGIVPIGTVNITTNGTHDVTNYASANVNVPTGSTPVLGTKTITENGTYTASSDSLDGYSEVTVNVPSSGITPTGTKQISITENGTTTEDIMNYASVEIDVDVPTSGGGSTDTFAEICNGTLTSYESEELTRIPSNTLRSINNIIAMKVPNLEDIASYGLAGYRGTVLVLPSFTGSIYAAGFAVSGASNLTTVDIGTKVSRFYGNFFNGASNFNTLIIRKTSIPTLSNVNAFANTCFKNGGTGGTIYIPKVLYDQLGSGTNDYQSTSQWSTLHGYGTVTWAQIEGPQYENYYADGTPIS